MYVATADANYSFAMEVLCSLPLWPDYSPAADLCEDLGLTSQAPLQQAFSQLRKAGYALCTRYSQEDERPGLRVAVNQVSWMAARRDAGNYWARVYGDREITRCVDR